jgi:hypothetical protein
MWVENAEEKGFKKAWNKTRKAGRHHFYLWAIVLFRLPAIVA